MTGLIMNKQFSLPLTDEQFRLIAPALSPARRAELLPYLNAAMVRFEINTKTRVAAFVSNLLHESEGLTRFFENLNYSASRLMQVFKTHFNAVDALDYAHDPEKIANRVYACRNGNADERSGDGWRFRGRGGIMRTGRKNYTRLMRATNLPCLTKPDVVAQPENSFTSDALFWSDNDLNALADCLTGRRDANEKKTLTAICERVNGGHNGLGARVDLYWRTLAVLNREQSAARASALLVKSIADSPLIPTPETHTPEQIAAINEQPEKVAEVETAVVAEQLKAARFIDLAEQMPASAARADCVSFWELYGGRIAQGFAFVGAAFKAGEFAVWLGLVVVLACLAVVVYYNRHDLKRWKTILFSKLKEGILPNVS